MTIPANNYRVVIVGGGFGGLMTAMRLKGAGVAVTIIDRRNHHLFQPLLYQVATTALGTSEIAWPIRHLMRRRPDVTTILGMVTSVDPRSKTVFLEDGSHIPYDWLVLATGARHAYFGHDEWAPFAPGLKTLEDATTIRRKLLLAFERAEREPEPVARAALLTFVIVGGGPTGVELAGALAELARTSLRGEFRNIRPDEAKIILVEAGPRLLPNFQPDLSAYAQHALEHLGVTVELDQPVSQVGPEIVVFGRRRVAARTVLWAAGVQASPAAQWLKAPADRAGRILVEPDLSVPGHPEIFAVGDTAFIKQADGRPVPGVGDAAKQGGKYVASVIRARVMGRPAPGPFVYRHAGDLATIGKRAAVIDFGRGLKFTGFLAWWMWSVAHIYFLIGVRNRLVVALSWLWIYLSGQRSARLITQGDEKAN
jgi:NADH dehydrogenase